VESPDQARRAARAFGGFAASLGDLAPDALHLTIPGFHDFEARVRALEHAVEADPAGRARAASDDIESARRAARALASELPPARLERLPLRVVHNDCKLNNVLFDESSGEALCVIDLDTVMPGTLLVDFGDLVRTAACPAAEDERDLSRVRVDPELYDALSRGYLEGIGGAIGTDEIELLPLAGPRIALETGIRFLTDHLEGDVYFRVSREGHNLDRARSQIRLTERLLGELAAARRRIERAARG
jgi:Ser/Thr protein kinase RdoA (MazF antagonist)